MLSWEKFKKIIFSVFVVLSVSGCLVFGLFSLILLSEVRQVNTLRMDVSRLQEESSEDKKKISELEDYKVKNENYKIRYEDQLSMFSNFQNNISSIMLEKAKELKLKRYYTSEICKYISLRVKNSGNFDDIYRAISFATFDELQSHILLDTITAWKEKALNKYSPTITNMSYPVLYPGLPLDGSNFYVSDGYNVLREKAVGGPKKHGAYDIATTEILAITYKGQVNRGAFAPGDVVSVFDGVVEYVGYSKYLYGNFIEIRHNIPEQLKTKYKNTKELYSFYAHFDKPTQLKVGDVVKAGQKIGEIGSTGNSTGPHLHFELKIYDPKGTYTSYNNLKYIAIDAFKYQK